MSESAMPSLEALRRDGAARVDPVRFRYLEALSRRVDGASGELRRVLVGKLEQALVDYGQRVASAQVAPRPAAGRVADGTSQAGSGHAALTELNQYIRARTKSLAGPGAEEHGHEAGSEIKSARRFRATWSRIAAEKQVNEAFVRGPENAGPLNAHMLMLHSLGLMRDLSPHYLQQFLSQVDSLLWLDQVNQKYSLSDGKAARPGRSRK